MNMVEIERALRELRLSGIAETLSTRVMQAQAAQEPFLETFAAMLQDELDRRRSRLMERRYKRSGLDERVTLADFDWRFNPKLPRSACFELHTLKFIAEGECFAGAAHSQLCWVCPSGRSSETEARQRSSVAGSTLAAMAVPVSTSSWASAAAISVRIARSCTITSLFLYSH
jgi:hypothetical protein